MNLPSQFKIAFFLVMAVAFLAMAITLKWLYDSREGYKLKYKKEESEKHQYIQTIGKMVNDAEKEMKNRTDYLSKLEQSENERIRLENCIADKSCVATIRVRVPATCSTAKSDPGGIVTSSYELDSNAQRAYTNLKTGIEKLEAKYAFCQETLRNWAN